MTHAGRPFLEMPRRYVLQLNVDWFQPYKHSPYSSGGIYLSLMNLPRSERLKKENVLTAGVIPGPDEPSLSINTYLRPLVDELIDLWSNGFKYKARDDDQVRSDALYLKKKNWHTSRITICTNAKHIIKA